MVRYLALPMFGRGDDHSSHVIHMSGSLLQYVQLFIVAIGLDLKPQLNQISTRQT